MLFALLFASLPTSLAGDIAVGDTTTIEIDGSSPYWHETLILDEGCYDLELVAGPTYVAWNAWGTATSSCDGTGQSCSRGYLTDYRLRASVDYPGANAGTLASSADSSTTPLMGRAPGGYYATAGIALAASAGMVDSVCLTATQQVDFNVGDWGKEADNGGGLTVEITHIDTSTDEDDDGVDDEVDNCPFLFNPDQGDNDGDGIGDLCDDDDDNDGVLDVDDNCPLVVNSDQLDTDGDGQGDECDGDDDDDGVIDDDDLCPDTPAGAVVDADGCSGAQGVDLDCPPDDPWASAGAYMSCVAGAVNDAVAAGLLTNKEGAALKKAAARSGIGQ